MAAERGGAIKKAPIDGANLGETVAIVALNPIVKFHRLSVAKRSRYCYSVVAQPEVANTGS